MTEVRSRRCRNESKRKATRAGLTKKALRTWTSAVCSMNSRPDHNRVPERILRCDPRKLTLLVLAFFFVDQKSVLDGGQQAVQRAPHLGLDVVSSANPAHLKPANFRRALDDIRKHRAHILSAELSTLISRAVAPAHGVQQLN